jgi:hypothetical protein
LTVSLSQPLAPEGCGERNQDRVVHEVALADALRERARAEQRVGCEAADGDDQLWTEEPELVLAPAGAEAPFGRCRRAVAAAAGPARITPCDGGAIEGRVEGVLVELEPAPQRPPCTAAPGRALLTLDDPGRLTVEVRALRALAVHDWK